MATVTVNRASVYAFKHLTLKPGDNQVSEADAAMLASQSGVQRDVARGLLSLPAQESEPSLGPNDSGQSPEGDESQSGQDADTGDSDQPAQDSDADAGKSGKPKGGKAKSE